MTQATAIDLGHVARDLNLPAEKVAHAVELLDEGNTVPFITRYRKDQTGGLDEEQIRAIQFVVGKARQLAERKATILKTIEAQGKLTPELAEQIRHANTAKRLEDLYLPFKPKKQTLATVARERGLEPLAVEIYEAHPDAADLQARAATFLSADKELHTIDDVLTGVRHLIAERFSEYPELRGRLRRIFQRTGKIVCTKIEPAAGAAETTPQQEPSSAVPPEGESGRGGEGESVRGGEKSQGSTGDEGANEAETSGAQAAVPSGQDQPSAESPQVVEEATPPDSGLPNSNSTSTPEPTLAPALPLSPSPSLEPSAESATAEQPPSGEALPAGRLFEPPAEPAAPPPAAPDLKKKKKKKKKKVIGEHAFKDYYNYSEPLGKVPPHRMLAINRGERAHAIRVRIEADEAALLREAEEFLIAPNHPHAEFIRGCVRDSLTRLIIPSLEREIRREMTDRAEEHAVDVFVRNLRKLLLQPPVRGRRVLAIDPGFKSGSKMAALDEFGNVVGTGMIFVIGKDEEKRRRARVRLADMVRTHDVSIIAIGNGTGCRETEQLVADCLAEELKDRDLAYVIVNEAGASIYSTSPLGREELPQYDALQRGAISIGRRLLDPLSEMVKIHPANLGVGLYQHDIKAKHLKDSLDAVVESCVNFVGVDVNSASPALLRYVSGMNALTARRVYEYRREHGPFKNREELQKVQGFGEQTFVQAAGFLKVIGGENPLDATWIHPESYDIARGVLEKIGCDVSELAQAVPAPVKKEEPKQFAAELVEQESGDRNQESETGDRGQEAASQDSGDQEQQSESVAETHEVPSTEHSAPSTEIPSTESSSEVDAAPSAEPAPAAASAAPSPQPPAPSPSKNPIAERAAGVNAERLALELGVGTHLLSDILASLMRPALDPRDNLPPPVFRRGIMKLEDLSPGMELSATVLNVVDFGAFVDIGLPDSGLVHISRLADRYIRDPHEVVGVGDVLKVWVVDVDKSRRRVSLTAIAPGSERPPRPPREKRGQRPPRQRQPQQGARPALQPAGQADGQQGGRPQGGRPPQGQRPQRQYGGGGRREHGRGRPQAQHPKTVERRPTKPKPVKPITKAMEEGKEPLRSFSDLMQLFDKKKQQTKTEEPPPDTSPSA